MEIYYKPSEAAKFLGVSIRTIKNMKKDGRIVPDIVDATGHFFYSQSQLLKIKNGENGANGAKTVQNGEISQTVQNGETVQKSVQKSVQNGETVQNGIIENGANSVQTVQTVQNGIIENGIIENGANLVQKQKTALEADTITQENGITSEQKSKDIATSYDEWIRQRKELADRARPYLSNLLYELGVHNLNKNFRCLNPSHSDSTPSMTYYADTHTVYCHGCGFYGDIFSVYSLVRGLPINKALFDEVFEKYGLIDHFANNKKIKLSVKPKIAPVTPPSDAKKELIDRSAEINAAITNLQLTDYWQKRGFTLETAQHFRMGFIPHWVHPDFNTPPSDRLILPTGDGVFSYLARDVHSDGAFKVLKVGGKVLFNLDGLNGEYIIVNEGEFDAISTYQVGFHNVVGLGGTGNKDKFIEAVTTLTVKPKFVIIALDNDKPGLDAAQWIHSELDKLLIYSVVINEAFGDDKDANALLQRDSDALKAIYDKAIAQANIDYETYQFPDVTQEDNDEDTETIPLWHLSDEILEQLMYFPITEAGNGERLNHAYGSRLIHYLQDSARWLLFNGVYWQKAFDNSNSSVVYPLLSMSRQLRNYANFKASQYSTELDSFITTTVTENGNTVTSTPNDTKSLEKMDKLRQNKAYAESIAKFTRLLEKRTAADNALYFAKGYPNIRITNDDLNRHKMLLNTPSGVVDLETGKLMQHDSSFLMTQCTNASYFPNYHNPFVEATIAQILPDDETRECFLLFLGYAISGSIKEEKAAFLNGAGRNGKGSLMKLLSKVLGSYAISIPIDLLLLSSFYRDGNAPSPELAKLEFIRVAFADEIPPNRRLDIAKFKNLTGGDPFTARELRRDPRMINDPRFKLIISGNHLPAIDDANDVAFKERTLIIPFTQQFTGDRCNPNLKDILLTPDCQSGFLTLLVEYGIKYLRNGLNISTAMKEASSEFLASNDNIGNFIDDNCILRGDLSISRTDFLRRIKASGCVPNMTDNTIIDAVKKIDGISYRRGGRAMVYQLFGIGWKDDDRQEYLDSLTDSDD